MPRKKKQLEPDPALPPLTLLDDDALDTLAAEAEEFENAWSLANFVRDRIGTFQDRQKFTKFFLPLVAKLPATEVDAVLGYAKDVFGYTLGTAKEEVKKLKAAGIGKSKIAATVYGDDFLAELVKTDDPACPVKFTCYSFARGKIDEFAVLAHEGVEYTPPQSKLIEDGTVILPTGVEEYCAEGEAEEDGQRRLFQEVRAFLARLNYVPEGKETSLDLDTAYIFLTWAHDRFKSIPYLHYEGDTGTGKTRRLETVSPLCYRPIVLTAALTSAPIFRLIERYKGTLSVDEADFRANDEVWRDILVIFNSGNRVGRRVIRCGDKSSAFEVESYNVFGPKIAATRKPFPDDALQSRCFHYVTQLVDADVLSAAGIPLELSDQDSAEMARLRNKLLLWRFRHYQDIAPSSERVPGVEPRVQQLAQPLLGLFPQDEEIKKVIRAHVQAHGQVVKEGRRGSLEGRLLQAMYRETRDADFKQWRTADLTQAVNFGVPPRLQVTETRVGTAMGHLGFEREHTASGNVWPASDKNKAALKRKARQYGLRIPVERTPVH